jgi:hypothetical protein
VKAVIAMLSNLKDGCPWCWWGFGSQLKYNHSVCTCQQWSRHNITWALYMDINREKFHLEHWAGCTACGLIQKVLCTKEGYGFN